MQIFEGQIRFGVHAGPQNTTWEQYVALWRHAEAVGLDWASVFDHFLPIMTDPEGPCFEGFTALAALAALVPRLRCGMIVSGITYRHPTLLAKMAATIDHVSKGRLELGIGGAWYELEHQQYGIPFPSAGRRLHMMGEAARIMKGMWTQHRTTIEGDFYQVRDALCEPKPMQNPLPLWIGGTGEKVTMRYVAEVADGWNTFLGPIEEYQRKLDILKAHAEKFGRNLSDIRKSLVFRAIVDDTDAHAEERARQVKGQELLNLWVGSADRCIEWLRPYARLGVGDFLLLGRAPFDFRTMEVLGRHVAPALKAQ